MRLLVGVANRSVVLTKAASEPLLAIAAAKSLLSYREAYPDAIKSLVSLLILRGEVIKKGLQGELYSRLLLIIARHQACAPDFVQPDRRVTPISVANFLETLLGEGLGLPSGGHGTRENAMASRMTRHKSDLINGQVGKGWINFTHIVQLKDPITTMDVRRLWAAWRRGSAFQCSHGQGLIDGLLPVYQANLSEPVNYKHLSYIVWQTKCRGKSAVSSSATALTGPALVDHMGQQSKPPHVALLMDLGATAAFQGFERSVRCQLSYSKPTQQGRADAAPPLPTMQPTSAERGELLRSTDGYAEPARFCLNIRGHDRRTYPVLGAVPSLSTLFELLEGEMPASIAQRTERLREDTDPYAPDNDRWRDPVVAIGSEDEMESESVPEYDLEAE